MRVLISAFAPFGGESKNPSLEVMRALLSSPPGGVELEGCELPVRRGAIGDALLPRFQAGRFDAWLGLGQAGDRAEICVERVGLNLLRLVNPDGSRGPEEPICPEGPAAHLSSIDAEAVADRIREIGAPARASLFAGTFLCNEAIYRMAEEAGGIQLFVHLPLLPEQVDGKPPGTASLDLGIQVEAVRSVLRFLVS